MKLLDDNDARRLEGVMRVLADAIKYAADTYYETEKNKAATEFHRQPPSGWVRDSSGGPA